MENAEKPESKTHNPAQLGSNKVFLRALEEADLDRTHLWHNDAELYDLLGDPFRFVSRIAEAEWLHRKATFSNAEINLAICLISTHEHIGNLYLREIDWISRRAILHIFIGPRKYRGMGYGGEAVRKLIKYAFHDLNLNRVYLEVLADNFGALRLYEKCGFTREGCLKQHCFKRGQFRDVVLMAITLQELKLQHA